MKPAPHYGYYVFLGLGDFDSRKVPSPMPAEWTSTWDASEWQRRFDTFVRLGTNTLFIYLMGHSLPYPSERFPQCVEAGHPNVKRDFFQGVLDRALDRGIELVAVFTTTGHAKGYVATRPDLGIWDLTGPRAGTGILCHNNAASHEYPLGVIRECLTRYHGFSGVILHPPEFNSPCYCANCKAKYEKEHGRRLADASSEEGKRFFMQTNLLFQRQVLEPEIRRLLPKVQLLTFTIPWIFETDFESFAKEIEPGTIIVDWDYRLTPEHVARVPARLQRYGQFGHKVWFMPTSGYAFVEDRPQAELEKAVLTQIGLCRDAGVRDIIYFMGPRWWPAVEGTSYYRANGHP